MVSPPAEWRSLNHISSVRSINVMIVAALALVCAPASAAAQPRGELAVAIYDQTGAPLSGVHITIRGGADREAQTSAVGDVAFQDLPEGDFEISAELSGFER